MSELYIIQTMRILIDLKKVNGSFNYKGRIRIKMKIGQTIGLSTESSNYSDGSYPFLEKHIVKVQKFTDHSYVELSILNESNFLLAQMTVFFKKFIDQKMIEVKNDKEVYKVYYEIMKIADDGQELPLRRTNTLEDGHDEINKQTGKIEFLRLGVLVYNFTQRLDPLIYLYNLFVDIVSWKNAYQTLGVGILLTIIIYNFKMTIFIVGLVLYFCKNYIFKRLEKLNKYKNHHKRMIVPEQNAFFIQHGMDSYCWLYDNVCQFLFNEDKTTLVNIINLICKMGTVLIILLFFFGVDHLLVIALWTFIIMTSPYRTTIIKYLKPTLEFVVGEYSKIVDKITTGISQALGSAVKVHQDQIQREFYFYKYQRWWVLKGWLDETKKYSDEDYECFVVPKDNPPEGWAWTEEWKIDYSGDVDSDGFQYSNDLKAEFKANSTLAVRRRRKWKRTCSKLSTINI